MGKADEVSDGELFRPFVHDGESEESREVIGVVAVGIELCQERFDVIAKGFASLVESGFYEPFEE